LGNLLGAMLPAIRLSQDPAHTALLFVADLHTLTSVQEPALRKANGYATVAAWLACGLDPTQVIFYRQSQVPAVCELAWYLNCVAPYPMLANAHAFKDKATRLADVSVGLFTYPVLMAADILLYEAQVVPVGPDQVQHLEITRDIAARFNHRYGETFVLPEAQLQSHIRTLPGTDGQKMSKSYHNTIDIFLPEKELKRVVMSIQTDSTPLAQAKDPEQCTVFALYSALAEADQVVAMRRKYQAGGYGYGQAKQALLALILDRFATERERFQAYMQDLGTIDQQLASGEAQARSLAQTTLAKVRERLGYLHSAVQA